MVQVGTGGDGSIRAIGRGLKVLQVINHHHSLSMMAIANLCELPYPTTCRIVETQLAEQMIERETTRKHYRPTALVRTLSAGYQPDDDLGLAARGPIARLTRDIRWPISVCSRVGMYMMIRESTHKIAPYTLNLYHRGYTMPILGSSSGKVYLAFSGDQDRDGIFEQLRTANAAQADRIILRLQAECGVIRQKGFAGYDRIRHTANPGKTSALSVPILTDGMCQGTATLAFFSSAMTLQDAIAAYLTSLKTTAAEIGAELQTLRLTQ
jgi:IclR family mhp operon transcriptional activator